MKKQAILASTLAVMFLLATAAAALAGDRRGKRHRSHPKQYHHPAPKHFGGHFKRHSNPHRSWGQRHSQYPAPRHRWSHHRNHGWHGWRAPRYPSHHRRPAWSGWGWGHAYRDRHGRSDWRPSERVRERSHEKKDFRRERGHDGDRRGWDRGDRRGGRAAREGGRRGQGRQRDL